MRIAVNKDRDVLVENDKGETYFLPCSFSEGYPDEYSVDELLSDFPGEQWEVVYNAPPLPKVNEYIHAELRDGRVVEGVVESVRGSSTGGFHAVKFRDVGGVYFIGGDEDGCDIVSWSVGTRAWSVGDTIPAGTVVGRAWLGRSLSGSLNLIAADDSSAFTQTLVWIADPE